MVDRTPYTKVMYIAILGRQPDISIAELEGVFDSSEVSLFSSEVAVIQTETLEVTKLGGTLKAGLAVAELSGDWSRISKKIISYYNDRFKNYTGKITLGISAYGFPVSSREIQKTGIVLKQKLKQQGTSLRLIPNDTPALSTATSHHNKLGLSDNKIELLVVRAQDGKAIVAESVGSQNITALARRDQGRPKRDAFVGMLPPKLAQIMINLAHPVDAGRILDPFCGTGVVLQEAALLGYSVYGSDLSEKMIRYSRDNLNWLKDSHELSFDWYLHEGDAMTTAWQQPIDAVVGEAYLGQPFSAPPSPAKLTEVRGNCNHIITAFLKNLAPQLASGTPLCLAVPAWRDASGRITRLPLINQLEELGYEQRLFANASDLTYYREDQVVARQLLVLTKK